MLDNDNMIEGKTEEELLAELDLLRDKPIAWRDVNDKGKVLNTIDNFQLLLDHYGVTIRYNEMKKYLEIDIPNETYAEDIELNAKIASLTSLSLGQELSVAHIQDYIWLIASQNAYHPVRDWMNTLQWDGVDRLPTFYSMITEDDNTLLKEVYMRKWALSAVAALYHTNFSCEGALTLYGDQSKGKTTFIERLIPRENHYVWNKDGAILNMNDKDSVLRAISYWITELGEIDATFKKSDIEALKAFLTSKYDEIRRPYGKATDRYARKTVFYATVNDEEFLRDDQNRRFWVIAVKEFNNVELDVAQFWAQMKHQYIQVKDKIGSMTDRVANNEWGWFLSPDELKMTLEYQERHKVADPIVQTLESKLRPAVGGIGEWMNCTQILTECGYMNINKSHTNAASKWLKKQGYGYEKRTKRYQVEFKGSDFFEKSVEVKRIEVPLAGNPLFALKNS